MLRTLQKAIEQRTEVGNYDSYYYVYADDMIYQVVEYHKTAICKFSSKYYMIDKSYGSVSTTRACNDCDRYCKEKGLIKLTKEEWYDYIKNNKENDL